jgi:hypothetical protein
MIYGMPMRNVEKIRLEQDTDTNLGRKTLETHTVFKNSVPTSQLNM